MALGRVIPLALVLALAGTPMRAETPEEVRQLEEAARAGDAAAALRLGTIHDFGLGVPRDASRALRWFLEAAQRGSVAAMFNVAVMLDFGTGLSARDATGAALWYARAGLRGHDRARYNLGLLYEAGDGVPHDPAMAAWWFRQAAGSIPAAMARAETQRPGPGTGTAPVPPRIAYLGTWQNAVDSVWTAPPAPPGAMHVLDLRVRDATGGVSVLRAQTRGSALRLDLSPGLRPLWARITTQADEDYAATAWVALEPAAGAPPGDRLRILSAPQDAAADRLARRIGEDMAAGGLSVTRERMAQPVAETRIGYRYAADAALARAIADALPGPVRVDRSEQTGWPGEITLYLAGGLADSGDAAPRSRAGDYPGAGRDLGAGSDG